LRPPAESADPAPGLGFFRGGARPPAALTVRFIDENRDELGVEPICRALQVAPSTYYAHKHRAHEPSARTRRDAVLMPILLALWVANRKVYGAHKLWTAARRAGHDVGRDHVARLMRAMDIHGVMSFPRSSGQLLLVADHAAWAAS
jgi:hypothetical protein